MKNKILLPILFACALIISFVVGMWWQKQIYLDICLDMGGGLNPGGYPICVLEKHIDSSNILEYNCNQGVSINVKLIESNFATIEIKDSTNKEIGFDALRVPSGSGSKYTDATGKMSYWQKDDECMILEDEKLIYSGCKLK